MIKRQERARDRSLSGNIMKEYNDGSLLLACIDMTDMSKKESAAQNNKPSTTSLS